MERPATDSWRHERWFDDTEVRAGEWRDFELTVSERSSGMPVKMPVRVWRGQKPGPVLLLTAALHGDELNGIGVIRGLIRDPGFELLAGTLVLVPVVSVYGFERRSRYLPDRRDLNRSFPGTAGGSLTSRFAHAVFEQLVSRCDYAIDFHTAAVQRTNFPNVRGDLRNPAVRRIARAFGCELVVHGLGPEGSLRRAATSAGRPTVLFEAGEVLKIEPSLVEVGLRGVRNVMAELGMLDEPLTRPIYQATIRKTKWVRADHGGMLDFHVSPGDVVREGQELASSTTLLGEHLGVITAPVDGVVMGMTTLPSVIPGDPVCHLAVPRGIKRITKALERAGRERLATRVREDLATNVAISEPDESSRGTKSRGWRRRR